MKTFIISFLSSISIMITLDSLWLTTMTKQFYIKHLGDLMAKTPNFFPAGIFYIIYASALSLIIIIPSIQTNENLLKAFLLGSLFGLAAYATYDLTNQAALKNWPMIVSVVDIAWGAILTGTVVLIATIITKHFS